MQIPALNPCSFSPTATSLLLVSAQGGYFNSLWFRQCIKPASLSPGDVPVAAIVQTGFAAHFHSNTGNLKLSSPFTYNLNNK